MTLDELRNRATITVVEASALLGVSQDNAYAAVKSGALPSLKLGRRILIPAARLRELLGDNPPTAPSA